MLEKLAARIEYADGPLQTRCAIWLGAKNDLGYGQVWDSESKRVVYAHRMSYEHTFGPLGDLYADHLCRTPPCINPLHLEPVTHGENLTRGYEFKYGDRNVCHQGHDMTTSAYVRPDGTGRYCRVCANTRRRRRLRKP